jgi:hypothetical protein
MAKSRRKAGGCTHGRFKRKKMGKGWLRLRTARGRPLPVDRSSKDDGSSSSTES